jgi:outer membrane protein
MEFRVWLHWHLLFSVLFFTMAVLPSARAQEMLSMEDCIRIALSERPTMRMAEQEWMAAGIRNHGSLAGRYPQVAFNMNTQGSIANQQNPASFLNGIIRTGNAAFSVDAAWTVFEGFRARIQQDQLGKLEGQARERLQNTSLQTAREVALAYLEAEWQQDQVDLMAQLLQFSSELYAYEMDRQQLGQSVRLSVLQSRDNLLADSTAFVLARLNLRLALINLRLAMGQPEMGEFRVGQSLQELPAALDGRLRDRMLANNPQLREMRLGREISRLQVRASQSAWYPSVSLIGGAVWTGNVVGLDGNNPFTGEPFGTRTGTNRNVYGGILLNLPIFDGGLRHRQVQEARVSELMADWAETNVRQQLVGRLQALRETLSTQWDIYAIALEQEANAREHLDLAEDRYKLGQLTIFDYRTVQLNYARAAAGLISARYNLRVTDIELQALSGDLLPAK